MKLSNNARVWRNEPQNQARIKDTTVETEGSQTHGGHPEVAYDVASETSTYAIADHVPSILSAQRSGAITLASCE